VLLATRWPVIYTVLLLRFETRYDIKC
jgi:hypothetical protein